MGDSDGERPRLEQVGTFMRAWRAAHPRATLSEIEDELDRQLRRIRAEMLTETATSGAAEQGVCLSCGATLTCRGERTRTLVTDGHAAITLQRPYASCPACSKRAFPPWMSSLGCYRAST